jgi:hypothetical protein
MTAFETGAKTAAANNLVLSVMNDGGVYKDRLHCGWAMIEGSSHRLTFRDLANNEAVKQRREFGSKFHAADISEAGKIIQAQTIAHCLETIREEWTGAPIRVYGRQWFDKINGNTYFSAKINVPTIKGNYGIVVPFQYGYGNHWQHEAVQVLRRIGFFADTDSRTTPNYTLPIEFEFQGRMLKKQMFDGMYI